MVEYFAKLRLEIFQVTLKIMVLRGGSCHRNVRLTYPDRLSFVHVNNHGDVIILARGINANGGSIIAKGLQGLAGLELGLAEQVFQPGFALLLPIHAIQR